MGRKIKVEYKKVLPPEEAARKEADRKASMMALDDRVSEFDLSDPSTRALYEKMVLFRDDKSRYELVFAKTITGPERKLVRAIGQRLGFFYRTEDNGEERFFKVARKPATISLKDKTPRKYSMNSVAPRSNLAGAGITPTLGTGIPAGLAIPDHRVPSAVASLGAAEQSGRIRAYSMGAQESMNRLSSSTSSIRKNSMISQTPPPGFNTLRQPKGPDTSLSGFGSNAPRKLSLNPGAPPFNVAEVQAAVEAANSKKHAVEILHPETKKPILPTEDKADEDTATEANTAAAEAAAVEQTPSA